MIDKKTSTLVELTETELNQVSGGQANIDQGSGKNPAGNKVGPFQGNPHDRPGANAKVTP
jgi:bacteriocin-like protein